MSKRLAHTHARARSNAHSAVLQEISSGCTVTERDGSSSEPVLDPLFAGDDVVLDGLSEVGVTDVNLTVLRLGEGRVAAAVNRHNNNNNNNNEL